MTLEEILAAKQAFTNYLALKERGMQNSIMGVTLKHTLIMAYHKWALWQRARGVEVPEPHGD